MLTLSGRVMAVLRHPERTARDGKTYPAYSQVQLMVEEFLQDGQKRFGMHTLSVEQPELFDPLQGQEIAVPVGVYARNGAVVLFAQKGATPAAAASGSRGEA